MLQIDGDTYRMRGPRARLATLRAGLNHPAEGGVFSRSPWGILTIVDKLAQVDLDTGAYAR